MSVIQSLKETSNKATLKGEQYIETSKKYLELKVFQQLTLVLSMITKVALVGGILFLALIFLLISAMIALGNYLDNMALSALIVSVFLILIALAGYTVRKKLDKKIIRKVAAEFFED